MEIRTMQEKVREKNKAMMEIEYKAQKQEQEQVEADLEFFD